MAKCTDLKKNQCWPMVKNLPRNNQFSAFCPEKIKILPRKKSAQIFEKFTPKKFFTQSPSPATDVLPLENHYKISCAFLQQCTLGTSVTVQVHTVPPAASTATVTATDSATTKALSGADMLTKPTVWCTNLESMSAK